MEWTTIFGLIDDRLLIVVAACWAVGVILKKTPKVADWTIVYIVTLFAIAFSMCLIGFTAEAVIQGILAGAFSVYGHQIVKQARQGDNNG